jgi:TPR repeat protein
MARHRRLAWAVLAAVVCGAIFAWLWHGERNSAAMFERVRAGAARGDAEAQYHLGSDYYYGHGVKQDYQEAVRWYRKSAMQGSAKARYSLAYCYAHGSGVTRDVDEAIRYLKQAADQGNPQALCQLATMYSEGRDLPWNRTEAFRLYRAAADRGDASGEYGLAYLYSHGAAEERDYAEAARWALKAAAKRDVQAESYLGGAYRWGLGVARDSAEATRWYGKAADQGDRAANLFLAGAYLRGEGVSRNYLKGAYHFTKGLGPSALRVLHRHGWTMYGGLLLLIIGAFAPIRLWGRQRWFSLAVTLIAAGMLLFQAIGTSFSTGVWRLIAICFFGVVAIVYGTGAIQGAVRSYKARTTTCS